VVVPDMDSTVWSGTTKSFSYGRNTETCAGQGLDRVFCTNCGSRVVTNNLKDGSGIVYVQEGPLDRLDVWFPPQAEVFTWSRQKGARPLDIPQFDHGRKWTGSRARAHFGSSRTTDHQPSDPDAEHPRQLTATRSA